MGSLHSNGSISLDTYLPDHTAVMRQQHCELLDELFDGEPGVDYPEDDDILDSEEWILALRDCIHERFPVAPEADEDEYPNGPVYFHQDFSRTHSAALFTMARTNPGAVDTIFKILSENYSADQIEELEELACVYGFDFACLLRQAGKDLLEIDGEFRTNLLTVQRALGENSAGVFDISLDLLCQHTRRCVEALILVGHDGISLLRSYGEEGLDIIEAHRDFFRQASIDVGSEIDEVYEKIPLRDLPRQHQFFQQVLADAGYRAADYFEALPDEVSAQEYVALERLWDEMGSDCIGLVQQCGLDACRISREKKEFIETIEPLTGDGTSDFLRYVPVSDWGLQASSQAERYREGTGRMYRYSFQNLIEDPQHRLLQDRSTEIFHIRNFYRYIEKRGGELNASLLEENLLNLDPDRYPHRPIALSFYARSDHSNAFTDSIVGSAFAILSDLRQHYKLYFFEVESKSEITQAIEMVGSLHGMRSDAPIRPIDLLSINAHGSRHLVQLGNSLKEDWYSRTGRLVPDESYISRYDRGLAAQWIRFLRDSALFDLAACSTAAPGRVEESNVFDRLADDLEGLRCFGAKDLAAYSGYQFDFRASQGYASRPLVTAPVAVRAGRRPVSFAEETDSIVSV